MKKIQDTKAKPANWNEDIAKRIEAEAGMGLTDEQIAIIEKAAVGSEATLKRRYAHELANGRVLALSKVSQTAYTMAISGRVPAMTMFWLKCRGRWQEVQRVEPEAGDDEEDQDGVAVLHRIRPPLRICRTTWSSQTSRSVGLILEAP